MDLNPDQAIAAGILKEHSVRSKLLESILRFTLHTSSQIVVLDRFMCERICRRGVDRARLSILPPWPHDEALRFDQERRQEFRRKHRLEEKFVVMYAGNHSPCHPLDTVVRAAEELAGETDIVFCFAGGGSEHNKIAEYARRNALRNILCLPYAPVEQLAGQLSAADLHVVVMGEPYVGIIHPCKVYNIVALRIPLLYIGPSESHVTDLAATGAIRSAFHAVPQNDVPRLVEAIRAARRKAAEKIPHREEITEQFSTRNSLLQLAKVIESVAPTQKVSPAERNAPTWAR